MTQMTMREAIRATLDHELERDPCVFLFGEDIADPMGGSYKVTLGLSTKYGAARVRNTPISEGAIVGAAVGAAITGMRPVAEIMYIDFMGIAMDQVVNQASLLNYMSGGQIEVPMVIRTHGGAGRSAGAQHSKSLEAWFCHLPGIKVVMPAFPADAKGLLLSAIRDPGPVIFFEHNSLYNSRGEVPTGDELVPIGKANLVRQGSDVTLVSYCRSLHLCVEAAHQLATDHGIEAEVIDLRTVSPLDEEAIVASVRKTHRLIIVHEANERFGVGAEVAALAVSKCFDYLDAPVERVATKNTPIPFAPLLERAVLPSVQEIIEVVRSLR